MSGNALLPWLLGALAGSMLFFAIVVAPVVFRALPADQGGRFLRAFFPAYYLWGCLLALACSTAAWLTTTGVATTAACLVVFILFGYARQLLLPQINRARDREQDGQHAPNAKFKRLHRQSVVINLAQLLILIGVSVYLYWW